MDLAVVERLVCPNEHATAPLVIRADRVVAGALHDGLLGCPVCRGEWLVSDGIAAFGPRAPLPPVLDADALTLAALLALADRGALIVVDGVDPAVSAELAREFGALVVALDSAAPGDALVASLESSAAAGGTVAGIDGAARVPFADSVRGVVLLRGGRDAAFGESAVRALAPLGRVVAAASIPVPDGVREIARDARLWVGVREHAGTPVTLRRGRG